MSKKQKTIAALDESIDRWRTKLRRAVGAIDRLEQRRKRLVKSLALAPRATTVTTPEPTTPQQPPVTMIAIAAPVETDHLPEREFEQLVEGSGFKRAMAAAQTGEAMDADFPSDPGDDAMLPAFLNRADPHVAERMTAARKKAEAEARKAMPLSGRAALNFIKSDEAVRKSRTRRKLREEKA